MIAPITARPAGDEGGEVDFPVEPDMTHVPHLEGRAYNQKPKSGWRDLRLMRFDGTDLYQWRGKPGINSGDRSWSLFEDQATEVFQIAARPSEPRPAEAVDREAKIQGALAMAKHCLTPLIGMKHLPVWAGAKSAQDFIDEALAALSSGPDDGEGRDNG